jgi:membrane fusion protein (multidrug efflux system)
VDAKQAAIDQLKAQLENANITLERQETLLKGPAGQQSNVDTALANQRALAAQVMGAEANLQMSDINLGYTEIAAPIDGKIGRTAVTPGNVVGPSSGVLATIVAQDPMYVIFPISVRTGLELRQRYMNAGGFNAVTLRIRLPDGHIYGQTGKLDFVDNTISTGTDTITLRGTIPNPHLNEGKDNQGTDRELADNEFVQVLLEGVEPIEVLAVPRAAVLSDQQGDYVYVVGADNKALRRTVKLGQSTPAVASVIDGLKEGEMVVSEGLQRVRPGQPVSPAPATPPPAVPPN